MALVSLVDLTKAGMEPSVFAEVDTTSLETLISVRHVTSTPHIMPLSGSVFAIEASMETDSRPALNVTLAVEDVQVPKLINALSVMM